MWQSVGMRMNTSGRMALRTHPHHIKVKATKDDKGKVVVELVELPGKAKRAEADLKARQKAKEDKEKQAEAAKNPLKSSCCRRF